MLVLIRGTKEKICLSALHELFGSEMNETSVFVDNFHDWATNFDYVKIP